MKKIALSLMTICLVAGIIGGGLFANWSDIETSRGNFFKAGAMDLKITTPDGGVWQDPNVPALIQVADAIPECMEKEIFVDIHNVGQALQPGVFVPMIHFKNLVCFELEERFEPEDAAELGTTPIGETVDGQPVYAAEDWTRPAGPDNPPLLGLGWGGDCNFAQHVSIELYVSWVGFEGPWTPVDLSAYDTNPVSPGVVKMDEVICQQIPLAPNLPFCEVLYLNIRMMLQDVPQQALGFDLPVHPKFNDWPTNALMKDGMSFDIAFELIQACPDNNVTVPPCPSCP